MAIRVKTKINKYSSIFIIINRLLHHVTLEYRVLLQLHRRKHRVTPSAPQPRFQARGGDSHRFGTEHFAEGPLAELEYRVRRKGFQGVVLTRVVVGFLDVIAASRDDLHQRLLQLPLVLLLPRSFFVVHELVKLSVRLRLKGPSAVVNLKELLTVFKSSFNGSDLVTFSELLADSIVLLGLLVCDHRHQLLAHRLLGLHFAFVKSFIKDADFFDLFLVCMGARLPRLQLS